VQNGATHVRTYRRIAILLDDDDDDDDEMR
jgi:hypothetical protein